VAAVAVVAAVVEAALRRAAWCRLAAIAAF
jgi:hypothetical protein